jgi:hypothetical protein
LVWWAQQLLVQGWWVLVQSQVLLVWLVWWEQQG